MIKIIPAVAEIGPQYRQENGKFIDCREVVGPSGTSASSSSNGLAKFAPGVFPAPFPPQQEQEFIRRSSRSSGSVLSNLGTSVGNSGGGGGGGGASRNSVNTKLGGSTQLGMTLSGSSSTPVEPIKPLLDLSAGGGAANRFFTLPSYPVFDEAAPRNVSGLAGNTVYLHCLVHNLADKSVSWIRQRDLHILTVGRYTYTTDQRYEVIHSVDSQDWILKIKYAQVRDSGTYECQVSTKPVRSFNVHLSVFAPQAEIIGAPDMYVDRGSTINLTCVIAYSPHPPAYIFWYHDGKVVNYDSPRGGVTVVMERGNTSYGYLVIEDARPPDSGNYTCAPSNTPSTSLRVHVLYGEEPAAMQTNGSGTSAAHAPSLPSFLLAAAVVFPFLILGDFPKYLGNLAIPEGARNPSHTPKDLLIKVPAKEDEDLLLRGTSTWPDEVALSST
ncbi:hemicentin-2-like [Penaeus indicus]|uniref:hemicentin-2-like n=1 Tax=Penaeus indicus TaxID=29960 RepID=UPI00300C2513